MGPSNWTAAEFTRGVWDVGLSEHAAPTVATAMMIAR
jgi:hypothetical protein